MEEEYISQRRYFDPRLGGVPRVVEAEIVRTIARNNPETLFIWSPLYVTNRQPDRYDGYVKSGVAKTADWQKPSPHTVGGS